MPPPRLRRLTQLYAGLTLYGFSDALMLLAGLGVDPWDVLHQGLSQRFGLGVGTWAIIVGAVVLALWIPLRQRPGFGTISNVVVVGAVIDLCMATIPAPHGLPLRTTFLLSGVFLNGVATGAYIGAGLGPGPRDGLMMGFAARGHSIRVVRTTLELGALASGWVLGGTVGIARSSTHWPSDLWRTSSSRSCASTSDRVGGADTRAPAVSLALASARASRGDVPPDAPAAKRVGRPNSSR